MTHAEKMMWLAITPLCGVVFLAGCAPRPISKSELHAMSLYSSLNSDSKQSVMWATEYLQRTEFPGVADGDTEDTDVHLRAAANADISWLEKQPTTVVRELDLGYDNFRSKQSPEYPSEVRLGGSRRP